MARQNPREMRLTIRADLPRKTDVTLREWATLVRISAPRESTTAQAAWLQKNYGLGAAQADVIVDFANGKEDDRPVVRH